MRSNETEVKKCMKCNKILVGESKKKYCTQCNIDRTRKLSLLGLVPLIVAPIAKILTRRK